MIGRVYRGHGTAGLIRYLYGPARTESPVAHHDPHLVASWLGHTPAVLAALEPVPLADAAADEGRALAAVGGRGLSAGAARAAAELAAAGGQGSVWDEPGGAQDARTGALSDAEGAARAGAGRRVVVPGSVDARHLVRALEAPLREQQRAARRGGPAPAAEHVWHVALRNADGDRRLTDGEWAQVAQDVVHRTGLSPRGPDGRPADGGCPWVAVRHDDTSIHLVVVLAREDGKAVRLWRDYRQLREACRAAEQTYGLTVTSPADRTTDTHTTRAEVEKAARLAAASGRPVPGSAARSTGDAGAGIAPSIRPGGGGAAEPARDQLRRHVQAVAAASASEQEFFSRLERGGLLVHRRWSTRHPLHATGYAVALPIRRACDRGREQDAAAPASAFAAGSGHGTGRTASGAPVYFGGGKLAPDLSLPQLRHRWSTRPEAALEAETASQSQGQAAPSLHPVPAGDAAGAWRQAGQAAEQGRTVVDAGSRQGASREQQDQAATAAWATADLLAVTARLLEGPDGSGPLSAAARQYGRAARPPRPNRSPYRLADDPGQISGRARLLPGQPDGHTGDSLRRAAALLGAVGRPIGSAGGGAGGDAALVLRLVAQVTDLVDAVHTLRAAQQHAAQAAAARAAAAGLRAAVRAPAGGAAAAVAVVAAAGSRPVAEELRAALRARQQSASGTAQPPRRPGPSLPPPTAPPRGARR